MEINKPITILSKNLRNFRITSEEIFKYILCKNYVGIKWNLLKYYKAHYDFEKKSEKVSQNF